MSGVEIVFAITGVAVALTAVIVGVITFVTKLIVDRIDSLNGSVSEVHHEFMEHLQWHSAREPSVPQPGD